MTSIEEIKQRKLQELQQQQMAASQQQMEIASQVQQLEDAIKPLMTKEAVERYGNLKAAHPQKAVQVLVAFGQAVQQGKITQIHDDDLKGVLIRLQSTKDIRITRK